MAAFSLFSSLRYDPQLLATLDNVPPSPFYLLHYHHDRILRAAHSFEWPSHATSPLTPASLLHACTSAAAASPTPLRLRVVLSPTGVLTVSAAPALPVPLESLLPQSLPPPAAHTATWRVHLDTQPTTPSPHTSHKTTSRQHYDAARARAGIEDLSCAEEVVLWNDHAECMEGSITSVYFWRNGRWVTPTLECGGNNGTTRLWLRERGVVAEGVVQVCSVSAGEVVLMSNGVRGVWAGVVQAAVVGAALVGLDAAERKPVERAACGRWGRRRPRC